MNTTWKTVRVFVSSTFLDMQAERDYLVRFVFPRLREELLKRRIHFIDVDLRWGVTSEQDALAVCREVIDQCHFFLCMLGGRYGWVPPGKIRSITADEVHYGILDRPVGDRRFAYFYFRDEAATAAMVETALGEFREPQDSDNREKLAELKQAIVAAGLNPFTYPARWDDENRRLLGLKTFGDRVYADLLAGITSDPALRQHFDADLAAPHDDFSEETAAMQAFMEERSERFVLGSREPVLDELLAHAEATGGNGYLCLTGSPGSGKSALLAHLSRHASLDDQPSTVLISHFVGASPDSTDVRRTLRRLCHELKANAPGMSADIPEDPEALRVAFPDFLRRACETKRVVIVIDAVNQFDAAPPAGLHWLPEVLPANARIILSTLAGPVLEALRRRSHPPREIALKPLTILSAVRIVKSFLRRYRKQMDRKQRRALMAKADAGTPLYLLTALEELRTLGTYEEITHRIAELPPTTQALFTWILERLQNDDGFRDAAGRRVGQALVSRFAALLGASRHGLSQRELIDLLDTGDPLGNVAALLRLLRPYLMHRSELLDFYHEQFRLAAKRQYLETGGQRLAAHRRMSAYFHRLACPQTRREWDKAPIRALSELPYQRIQDNRIRHTEHLFCDLRFIEASIRGGLLDQLLGDLDVASRSTTPNVICVRDAMFASAAAIRQRPHLGLQTIINRLRNEHSGSTLAAYLKRAEALMGKRGLWLCSMTPFGQNRLVRGIVSLSPQRRLFHVLTEQGEIEGRELNTQVLIERYAPFGADRPIATVVHPVTGRLVWMDASGIVYDGYSASLFRLRTREHGLSFFGAGLVGVDPDDALVFYDLKTQTTSILAKSINRIYTQIYTNPDRTAGIVVSGDKLPAQCIFLLTTQGTTPKLEAWPALESPVISACFDEDGATVLFATQGRRLKLFDCRTRSCIAELSARSADGVAVRGVVEQCRMTSYQENTYVVFTTKQGELCVWDFSSDVIHQRGYYRGIRQQDSLQVLEVLPADGKFVVATEEQMQVLDLEGRERSEVAAPVTHCSLTPDGWLITASSPAKYVRWHRGGRRCHERIVLYSTPTALASGRSPGIVFVGYHDGSVVRLQPDEEPQEEDAVDVFDRAVASVICLDGEWVLAASLNGQLSRVRFRPVQVFPVIPLVGNYREEKFVHRLGTGSDVLSCGRSLVGDSCWSAVAVRGDGSRETVFEMRETVDDIGSSKDGQAVYCVSGGKLYCYRRRPVGGILDRWRYRRRRTGWILDAERIADITRIVACEDDLLGVIVRVNGQIWFELWSTVDSGMATVAAMELPYHCTSLCSSGGTIAIGAIDGRHCMIAIKKRDSE